MKRKFITLVALQAMAALSLAQQVRIVGGGSTTLNAYPYMTALVEKGAAPSSGQFCGAALVAPQWVLTAGHCLEGTPATSLDVWIGGRDLRNAAEGVRVAVSQVIMHPNYGENSQGALQYDFCLLKLARPVTEKPILPLVDAVAAVAPGVSARAVGWGATSEGGSGSQTLLQVDLPLVSLAVAGQTIPGLNSTHLAAGRVAGGIDTCQGDSGGPLLVRNAAGAWSHGGTVSFGNGCARPGEYGIYGNTITVKAWIQGYIGNTTPTPVDDHGNTTATATAWAYATAATGQLGAASDVDIFRVALPGAGTFTVSSTGSTDVVGSILNSAGTAVATDDNSAGGVNFRASFSVTAATTVFVKVSGKTTATTGAYGLSGSFGTTPPAAGDIDLRVGTTVLAQNGSLSFGNAIMNSAGVNKTLTVFNTGKGTLTVNGASLSTGSFSLTSVPATTVLAGRSTSFIVSFKPAAVGTQTATLTVSSNDPDENPFTLTLTGNGQAAPDDHGNTLATATAVALPGSRAGIISSGTDVDFFRFTLAATRTVTLTTTGSLDSYGTLYNRSGTILEEADDDADLNFKITRSLPAGTYYLKVEGYSAEDIGSYTLVLK